MGIYHIYDIYIYIMYMYITITIYMYIIIYIHKYIQTNINKLFSIVTFDDTGGYPPFLDTPKRRLTPSSQAGSVPGCLSDEAVYLNIIISYSGWWFHPL